MARKPLRQLVPDLELAVSKATKKAAENIVTELKERGPYWTGQFESLWEVETGQTEIKGNIDESFINENGNIEYNGTEYINPGQRQITPAYIPEPEGLKGYTIGNIAKYAAEATDEKPGPRDTAKRLTDKFQTRYWFMKYAEGDEIKLDIEKGVDEAMKEEGFKKNG